MGRQSDPSRPVDIYVDAYNEALDALTARAKRFPNYADVQKRLGLFYELVGDPENAAACQRRALKNNADYLAARSALGYALEAAGDPDGAIQVWRDALPLGGGPDHPGTRLDLAMAEGRRGRPLQGLDLLNGYGHATPFDALIARERLLLQVLAGRDEHATATWLVLAERSPLVVELFEQDGLVDQGQIDADHVADFVTHRTINYNLSDIHIYLSDTYAACGAEHAAKRELWRGCSLDLDVAGYHVRLGRLARLGQRPEEAEHEFCQAIAFDPERVGARIEQGRERALAGDQAGAIRELETAAQLEPNFADVQHQLGLLYIEAGRLDEGIAAFERALSINAGFLLARASLALALRRAARYDEALAAYQQAVAGGLESADIYLNMALLELHLGQTQAALVTLRRGTQVGPRYAPLFYHLGKLYRELGDREEAREAWQRFFACADDMFLTGRLELFRDDLRGVLTSS